MEMLFYWKKFGNDQNQADLAIAVDENMNIFEVHCALGLQVKYNIKLTKVS